LSYEEPVVRRPGGPGALRRRGCPRFHRSHTHRLAVADGDRGPVRDRRGEAGHRGRLLLDVPEERADTKLSAYTPNVEAIERYKPDLVIASDDAHHLVRQFAKLHVKVLVQPAAANLKQTYAQLNQLGTITGHVPGATSWRR
jgi:ABC-type Fe3+-hydroxamate transport system, periplasmic component